MNYELLLETYPISDLLDMNDKSEEELLEYLIDSRFLKLPETLPLDFDE